ncbi:hypothetical protein [Sporichthya sp.]|uniref:hypothetical protein n=1 Tax=Sporichthya sp. TaxID=65475 RepID=UPI0017C10368|nr:hypothetical protein [Sporichthya sp.]MBA3742780.1 hypothetical protein [Sporichthya sp.]
MHRYLNFIDGDWRDSSAPRLDVDNPSTGEVTATLPDGLYAYTKTKSLYTALDTNLDARPYSAVGGEWE